ncbi:type I phosphomannose isomerase catalytic subunit [Thalassoroseus pseudoceratinae]|uniref:type I phosphomannose isomerase catalytic subunit n=1 Tax=Thalassoroseus pseudoceratinae TaxID=2713176 RepID=UPI0014236A21|nr:type I phosphomannose isomerase catalytic subunit [Thalassoroseus pseudoceratinae]
MPPLFFEPILKRIRWGGRRLGTELGKPIGPETDYAESWEISDHGEDQSLVTDGEFAGWSLKKLVTERNADIFGRHAGRKQFPLLVKFLDANDRLSVQVHPNDEQAKQYDPLENGKTEAWVIVHAEPGSQLYVGLQDGIGPEQLDEHLRAGTVEEILHTVTVHPGDCVFIPAGTIHAIGEGIVLAEIQQSSDLTFRLYDWGRLGADGKPREIHIESALECTNFDMGPVDPVEPQVKTASPIRTEELVQNDHFVMQRHIVPAGQTAKLSTDNRFHVYSVLGGSGKLTSGQPLNLGTTFLVPAACDDVEVQAAEELTLLEAFLP